MKIRKINGLQNVYPESIKGTAEWYYGKIAKDTFCDLDEAEEIIKLGHAYAGMNCVLMHFPEGTVYEPFSMQENVYVDAPVFLDGKLYFLVVDFNSRCMRIAAFDCESKETGDVAELSLDEVEDCYNLRLHVEPIMLVRYAQDDLLEIIYPEKKKIQMTKHEIMYFRSGDKLYSSAWYEDPDYHEKVIVRDWKTGEIVECFEGMIRRMPDGVVWIS